MGPRMPPVTITPPTNTHGSQLEVFKVNCSFFGTQPTAAAAPAPRDDRPHIPVLVQGKNKSPGAVVWPLIDSGAAVNLAEASILQLVPDAEPCGPPIIIHDINQNIQKTIRIHILTIQIHIQTIKIHNI